MSLPPREEQSFRGAAVVLAAGASRRMGAAKHHLPYAGGTFLTTILERLEPLALPWVGVVCARLEDLPARVVVNPDPSPGPISSLQAGLRAGAREYPWVMVVHVDRPAVKASTYRALALAAEAGGADLWAPAYRGRRGHPVVFGRPCYEDLNRVPPGEGARWVVGRHRARRATVPVEDPAILANVNTPGDYRRLR